MLWKTEILRYQNIHGLNVTRQAMDCAHRKNPIGQDKVGVRPVDRKKQGTKLGVLSSENGVIIGISVGSARDYDIRLCHKTPQSLPSCAYSRDIQKCISMQHMIHNVYKLCSLPTIFQK